MKIRCFHSQFLKNTRTTLWPAGLSFIIKTSEKIVAPSNYILCFHPRPVFSCNSSYVQNNVINKCWRNYICLWTPGGLWSQLGYCISWFRKTQPWHGVWYAQRIERKWIHSLMAIQGWIQRSFMGGWTLVDFSHINRKIVLTENVKHAKVFDS